MKRQTKAGGFTDQLRERVKASMDVCPTCGNTGMSQREVARRAGVDPATLCRFLAGGRPSAPLVDSLSEYLAAIEAPQEKRERRRA